MKESAQERGLADLEMHESLVSKAKELLDIVHKAKERGLSVQVVVNTTRKKSSVETNRHFNKYSKRVKSTLIDNSQTSCLIHLAIALAMLMLTCPAQARDRDAGLKLGINNRGENYIKPDPEHPIQLIPADSVEICGWSKPFYNGYGAQRIPEYCKKGKKQKKAP